MVAKFVRRAVASLAVLGMIAVGFVAVDTASAPPAHATLSGFNPSNIMSDAVFFNSKTMNVSQIQSFFKSKVPSCKRGAVCLINFSQNTTSHKADAMCGAYNGAKNESAAMIVYKVATACGINPQVLITTLQKEQGLVTLSSARAGSWQWKASMGYACPDSSVCDTQYYGFFNQVYHAAWQFKRYGNPRGTSNFFTWYPVGRTSYVQYNPDKSCGGTNLVIANKATAALYYYTPYQPTASALAAGYGAASDYCGSYGNRNFYNYFTDWFGSTQGYPPASQLKSLWTKLGGASGKLGAAMKKPENYSGRGVGQEFQKGWAYWSKSTGAFMTSGVIGRSYITLVGPLGVLGYPTAAVKGEPRGALSQAFQKGSLYTTPSGKIHRVSANIRTAYLAAKGPGGSLGYPTDSVRSGPKNGEYETFEKGRIYWTSAAGAIVLPSAILKTYDAVGGPSGSLGYPIVKQKTAGGVNTIQFAGGVITWSGSSTPAVKLNSKISVDRVSGADRYATSVAISKKGYPSTAPVVYVATGQDFADALSAAPAATKQGGPLLLTRSTTLPANVKAEIRRLKPKKIVIVGGTGVVSSRVEKQLKSIATVKRIGGATRYQTSANVAGYAFGTSKKVYVATGRDYPDALSAAAAAGAQESPVILVDSRYKSVPSATLNRIKALKPSKAYVVGGTGVVNSSIMRAVAKVVSTSRLGGADRYATNQAIQKSQLPSSTEVFIATGRDFPDALAGAALSSHRLAPLYLVPTNCIPDAAWLNITLSGASKMTLIGGPGVVTTAVSSLKRCR